MVGSHHVVLPIFGRSTSQEVQHVTSQPPVPFPHYATVPITFGAEDCNTPFYPYADAFIISANVTGVEVQRIIIDGRSSADLLFALAFDCMGLSWTQLTRTGIPLCGFGG